MSLPFTARMAFSALFLFGNVAELYAQTESAMPVNQSESSFDELRAGVTGLQSKGDSGDSIPKLIDEWLDGKDINGLSVEQVEWCLAKSLPNKTDRKAFSVVWTGFLTPPRQGNYTFSVSPINVNKRFGPDFVRHTISVSIAGMTVVDVGPKEDKKPVGRSDSQLRELAEAQPAEWQWMGAPIELKAGQPVPVHVEMAYECREPSQADSPSVILFWEGPGMDRRPVDREVFTLPDQTGKGLKAEYQLQYQTEPRTVVQVSPNVDYAWATPADVAPINPELVARLTNRLWHLCTASDYFAECTAGRIVHAYFQDNRSTEFLSCAQRREFLQLLTENPELLNRVDDEQLVQLYRNLRFGAEYDAVDMLGAWMQLHADVTPKITADFFRENRQLYAKLAIHLARQLPDGYRVLHDRYLEMPDGRCALPVAYTLSYSVLAVPPVLTDLENIKRPKSPSSDWSELLDAKLEDTSITGDVRVNWLIAEAQSLEQRGPVLSGSSRPHETYLAGMGWLTEAHVVVEENATRTRIYAEEVARAAALNRESQVNELLHAAADTVPPEELNAWRAATEAISQKWRDRRVADSQLVRSAYIKTIQRRRERASQRNDDKTVERYDEILKNWSPDSQ